MTSIIDVRTVAVPVTDQDRALRFYRDTLAFTVRHDSGPGDSRWIEVAAPAATVTLALSIDGSPRAAVTDTGIRFTVPDATSEHRNLADSGVTVGDLLQWPGVPPMFSFDDPDGNRFYILEQSQGAPR